MNKKFNGILLLFCAIFAEVISTTNIKIAEGFTKLIPSILAIIFIILAMFFLAKALNYLPLSIAYAIWVGAGTAMIYIISVFLFNEPVTFVKITGLLMIIGGIIALNYLQAEAQSDTQAEASSS